MVPALSSISFMRCLPFSRSLEREAYRLYVSTCGRRRAHQSGCRRPPHALRRGRGRTTAGPPSRLAAALVELAESHRAVGSPVPGDLPGHTGDGVDRCAARRLPPPHAHARPAAPARQARARALPPRRARLGIPDRLLRVLYRATAHRALRADGRHHAVERDRRAAAPLPAPVAHLSTRLARRTETRPRGRAQPPARLA